jgi:SAM-dependent methyltransferase
MWSPRRALYRIYWRLEGLLAPGLRYAQDAYEGRLGEAIPRGCRWLDLGCGHQLLPEWRRATEATLVQRAGMLVGLDPEREALRQHRTIALRIAGDATALPFADAAFDRVTANMVVEHLPDPRRQFAEIRRILRPGGRFIFHTPNREGHYVRLARLVPEAVKSLGVWLLEGRRPADRFPTYYRANSEGDIVSSAVAAGLRLVEIEFVASTALFAVVAPLAILELLWIRLTQRRFPRLRSNLVVVLERPVDAVANEGRPT